MTIDPVAIGVIFACLMLGGIVKGATGAGAPLFAIPAVTALFDVKLAITIMIMPNIVTNVWQAWTFRKNTRSQKFLLPFLASALVGLIVGTWALVVIPDRPLAGLLCLALVAYLIVRLAKPHWAINVEQGKALAFPAGFVSGGLQGVSGLSAPASLTYLSAMRLPRPAFVGSVSQLFLLLATVQLIALWFAGILTLEGLALSAMSIVPVVAGMPIGNWLMKFVSPEIFQSLLLVLLAGLAIALALKAFGLG